MYDRYEQGKAFSQLSIGVLCILIALGTFVTYEFQSVGSVAEKVITPIFFISIAILATLMARNIGVFKKNFFITPLYIFLIVGALNYPNGYWEGYVVTLLLLMTWYNTVIIGNESNEIWYIFDSAAMLSVASIFEINLLVILPILLIGYALYHKLNIRTLTATILGSIIVFLTLWSVAFIFDKDIELANYMKNTVMHLNIINLRKIDIIIYCTILLYLIIAYISFITRYNSNNTYLRISLNFTYLLILTCILLLIFTGRRDILEPAICTISTIVLTRFSETIHSKAGRIIFYIFTALLILLFIAKNFIF